MHGRGYHLVSIAYRLIPQVSFEDQVEDMQDAYKWLRAHLPKIVGEDRVDLDAYITAGDSAGGTSSTLLGHILEPPPKAVIDAFGVVDMAASAHAESAKAFQLPYLKKERTDEEVRKAIADRDPKNASCEGAWSWELEGMTQDELRIFWGAPEYNVTDANDWMRMDMNSYMAKNHLRWRTMFRADDVGDEAFEKALLKWSPYHMVDERKTYPPTFILHGTADSAVPVEQSYKLEKKLNEKGVPVGARYAEGLEHSFENIVHGPGDYGWEEWIVPCMDFVDKYVRQ